jgi:hypothetical protein
MGQGEGSLQVTPWVTVKWPSNPALGPDPHRRRRRPPRSPVGPSLDNNAGVMPPKMEASARTVSRNAGAEVQAPCNIARCF